MFASLRIEVKHGINLENVKFILRGRRCSDWRNGFFHYNGRAEIVFPVFVISFLKPKKGGKSENCKKKFSDGNKILFL